MLETKLATTTSNFVDQIKVSDDNGIVDFNKEQF